MAHVLIVGMPSSGKTNLAKILASEWRARGYEALLFDPVGDPEWPVDPRYRYSDADAFVHAAMHEALSCALFIDESSEAVGQYDRENFILASRSRHRGHTAHFLGQRLNQIAPGVRSLCEWVYAFRVGPKEAKILAEEWGKEALLEACNLPQYHAIRVHRFGEAEICTPPPFGGGVPNGIGGV